jgi:hypothetical protein
LFRVDVAVRGTVYVDIYEADASQCIIFTAVHNCLLVCVWPDDGGKLGIICIAIKTQGQGFFATDARVSKGDIKKDL